MKPAKRNTLITVVMSICLLGLCAADLLYGGKPTDEILQYLRLPRVLTAVLATGALAVAGSQMQSIFRNPLADPYIMGVSSGAALGAALVTMAGIQSGLSISLAAISGAAISSAVILLTASKVHSANTLLTFGILLGFFTSAIITILQYVSPADSLKLYYAWSAGSYSTAAYSDIVIIAIALVAGLALGIGGAKGLDLILFGDEFTTLSGASPRRIRLSAILSSCLIAGSVTAFCGPIGFVGIVAPQIVREMFKTSTHRIVVPLSFLIGAFIGVFADLISQIFRLPVSATMALFGIPVIVVMLLRPSPGRK